MDCDNLNMLKAFIILSVSTFVSIITLEHLWGSEISFLEIFVASMLIDVAVAVIIAPPLLRSGPVRCKAAFLKEKSLDYTSYAFNVGIVSAALMVLALYLTIKGLDYSHLFVLIFAVVAAICMAFVYLKERW